MRAAVFLPVATPFFLAKLVVRRGLQAELPDSLLRSALDKSTDLPNKLPCLECGDLSALARSGSAKLAPCAHGAAPARSGSARVALRARFARMRSRPKSCSAARVLWERQRSARLSIVGGPPRPCGCW